MNSRNRLHPLVAVLCAIPLLLAVPARAADDDDLGTLVNKALQAMRAEKWEEALQFNTRAIERYGANQPMQLFGPRFGQIYYRKGICEMKFQMWKEAMESFEKCYRDFPNSEKAVAENPFNKLALLRWAEASMGAGQYDEALNLFKKFLDERDPVRDTYPQGQFHINLAICHYKLGNIPEGNQYLEIAIRNKLRFPTSDTAIIAAFQELVTSAIENGNEQALLDFMDKNLGELIIAPHQMHRYSKVFMKLAADAISTDMDRAAMALYQLVPSTDSAIDDVRTRLKGATTNRAALEKELAALEEERRSKNSNEMIKLAATAFLHEKNENIRGAFAAYLQLETYYPISSKREDNLYNLIRTSSVVGNAADTRRFAEIFISTYPESRHLPSVRRLLLSVLFYEGKYETCIEIAESMILQLEEGTPEHDLCLHVLGGSYYYTGQFETAQPRLDEHVEKYKESMFLQAATYFQASNQSRLGNWTKAAGLLDVFLSIHSDPSTNMFMPFALYDRANCHYALEQPEAALDLIARIVREFPTAQNIDQAYILRGNVEESLENFDRAEQAYVSALESAVKLDHPMVAGEALYSLVVLLGKPEGSRIQDAVPYADRFWEQFAEDSPYRARMAMAQFPAMAAVDRTDDGLEILRNMIIETAASEIDFGIEDLIITYTDAYLTKHTPQEFRDHYYNFPGIRSTDTAVLALLRVDIIRVFEGLVRKAQDETAKNTLRATIKVLFQELKTDFALKDLANTILVKVGDYLRKNTATPREALPYYDEVLSRGKTEERFKALLGRGDVNGNSATPADIDKALEDFEIVFTESEDDEDRDFALFRIIELLMAKKDFAKAQERALVYLDREKSGLSKPKHSPDVGLLLARSYDELKMVNDAIAMYVKVWAAHTGNIRISAPAMIRWMELSWIRNNVSNDPAIPSDRQGAYEGGARYVESTGRFKDKMIESDLQLWQEVEKLVQTYGANPNIKSMREINREKEDAQRMRIRR
jgi:tetratricopeptide (TPR) repeat protein